MEWIWYISILYGNIYIIGYEDDPEAFIFTLKNPHGVKPTRFMKRKESDKAIVRDLKYGPIFGNGFDIYIGSLCNKEDGCSINSDGTHDGLHPNNLGHSILVNNHIEQFIINLMST